MRRRRRRRARGRRVATALKGPRPAPPLLKAPRLVPLLLKVQRPSPRLPPPPNRRGALVGPEGPAGLLGWGWRVFSLLRPPPGTLDWGPNVDALHWDHGDTVLGTLLRAWGHQAGDVGDTGEPVMGTLGTPCWDRGDTMPAVWGTKMATLCQDHGDSVLGTLVWGHWGPCDVGP